MDKKRMASRAKNILMIEHSIENVKRKRYHSSSVVTLRESDGVVGYSEFLAM